MPIQDQPRIDVNDATIYKRCSTSSDEMPALVTTEITYIDKDVTGDGIKERMAKYTEKKWVCPKGFREDERGIEILQYGAPKARSKGIVKNSKGDSFARNDTVLIGNERFYVVDIPEQAFEKIPTPDDFRIVLIPEKTLDKIRTVQSSAEFLEFQKRYVALRKSYAEDPNSVDEKEAKEVQTQLRGYAEKNNKMIATTVVAKRAGDIEKAGDLPIKQEDKDAFLGMVEFLHEEENTAFLKDLILIAFRNLAKEEVAAETPQE